MGDCVHIDKKKKPAAWMPGGTVYCLRRNEFVGDMVCRECPEGKTATTSALNDIITNHIEAAKRLALQEIERIARKILRENDDLDEFIMANGTYLITTKKRGLHFSIKEMDNRFTELVFFISAWDDRLKVTGSPMRFSSHSEVRTEWELGWVPAPGELNAP